MSDDDTYPYEEILCHDDKVKLNVWYKKSRYEEGRGRRSLTQNAYAGYSQVQQTPWRDLGRKGVFLCMSSRRKRLYDRLIKYGLLIRWRVGKRVVHVPSLLLQKRICSHMHAYNTDHSKEDMIKYGYSPLCVGRTVTEVVTGLVEKLPPLRKRVGVQMSSLQLTLLRLKLFAVIAAINDGLTLPAQKTGRRLSGNKETAKQQHGKSDSGVS